MPQCLIPVTVRKSQLYLQAELIQTGICCFQLLN